MARPVESEYPHSTPTCVGPVLVLVVSVAFLGISTSAGVGIGVGLVAADTAIFKNRYTPYRTFRVGLAGGFRWLDYLHVQGFDALIGEQDVVRVRLSRDPGGSVEVGLIYDTTHLSLQDFSGTPINNTGGREGTARPSTAQGT